MIRLGTPLEIKLSQNRDHECPNARVNIFTRFQATSPKLQHLKHHKLKPLPSQSFSLALWIKLRQAAETQHKKLQQPQPTNPHHNLKSPGAQPRQ